MEMTAFRREGPRHGQPVGLHALERALKKFSERSLARAPTGFLTRAQRPLPQRDNGHGDDEAVEEIPGQRDFAARARPVEREDVPLAEVDVVVAQRFLVAIGP